VHDSDSKVVVLNEAVVNTNRSCVCRVSAISVGENAITHVTINPAYHGWGAATRQKSSRIEKERD
jgi:hypothetical protein